MTSNVKVARKYSSALFVVAEKKKQVNEVLKDLSRVKELFSTFSKPIKLLNDPIYRDNVRFDFVQKISKQCGFCKLTINFLKILALKRRFNLVEEIVENYTELHHSMNNVEKVEVVSVTSLTKSEMNLIEKFFSENFKKKIWINNLVDPSIIGGMTIKIGSVIFDNSMLNKLNRLQLFTEEEIKID